MAKEGTLLIVDDNRSILAALRLLLEKYFARVLTLPTPNRLATTLREEQIDVILLDMNFTAGINTGNEGIYWLSEIHARRPDIKVVLFTAYADIDLAVRAMRDGAVDFVVKPWDNDRLVASLRQHPDHGGERHRQGDAGTRDTQPLGAQRRTDGFGGYGSRTRNALRERTVRPCQGSLHRRPGRPRREIRGRRPRHAFPRRDRQPAAPPAIEAADGHPGRAYLPRGQQHARSGGHPPHLRHEPRPVRNGSAGGGSFAKICSTASTRSI